MNITYQFLAKLAKYSPTRKIPPLIDMVLRDELKKIFPTLSKGKVLDIGSGFYPYLNQIPHTKYVTLDIISACKPNVQADAHFIPFTNSTFNSIVATELLEHLHDPQKAINEMYRVLKTKGTCVLSTPFIYPFHPCPKDYYRLTPDSIKELFKQFSSLKIIPYGNRVQSSWQVFSVGTPGIILNLLNPIFYLVKYKDNLLPMGHVIVAKK